MILFVIATISTALVILLMLYNGFVGVQAFVLLKPIIDTSWNHGYFGINNLRLIGVVVPLFLVVKVFLVDAERKKGLTGIFLGVLLLMINLPGTFMVIGSGDFMGAINTIFRYLNAFLGLYIFQMYFSDVKTFKRLLILILVAGLFPIGMGIYQSITGEIWQMRKAAGLTRLVGLYHDAFSLRHYAFQTLTGILLYWSYFSVKKTSLKIFLLAFGAACVVVIFNLFSKAALASVVVWTFCWCLLNKRIGLFFVMGFVMVIVNLATGGAMIEQATQVFSKEIGAYEGTMDEKFALSGRMGIWGYYFEKWQNSGPIEQIIGTGHMGSYHSEFLRVLITNGLVGLIVYLFILAFIGLRVAGNVMKKNSPLNVMALMIYLMFILDCIGLTPGVYPSYMIYIFGFLMLSIRGVDGLDEHYAAIKNKAPSHQET